MKYFNVSLHPKSKNVIFNNDTPNSLCIKQFPHRQRKAEVHVLTGSELRAEQLKLAAMVSDEDISDEEDIKIPRSKIRSDVTFPFLDELQSSSDDDTDTEPDPAKKIPLATQIRELPGIPDALRQILLKYQQNFDPELTAHLTVPGHKFDIIIDNNKPFYQKARPIPAKYHKKLKKILKKYVRFKIIAPRVAARFVSALHVVPKKNDDIRCTVDMRIINERTIPLKSPIPSFDEILTKINLTEFNFISSIDLTDAFFNIEASDRAKEYLVFNTIYGVFGLLRMAMGCKSASETFQGVLNVLFANETFIIIFIDDILILSKTRQLHLQHIDKTLKILSDNNFTINLRKCTFFQTTVEFLGYKLTQNSLQPLEAKCMAIRHLDYPQNHSQLRAFLGVFTFNRRFNYNAAEILDVLYKMVDPKHKKKAIIWTEEQKKAFDNAKKALDDSVKISFFKPNHHLCIVTDASETALAGVLCQTETKPDPDEHFMNDITGNKEVLQMYSRPFKTTEKKYNIFLKELIAIRDSLRYFHNNIFGRQIVIFSDNKAVVNLLMLATNLELNARVHKIFIEILQYTPTVYFISTKSNFLCDTLSRNCVFKPNQLQQQSNGKINFTSFQRPDPDFNTIHNSANILGLIRQHQVDNDLIQLAQEQPNDRWIQSLQNENNQGTLEIVERQLEGTNLKVKGDISTGFFRLLIPSSLRNRFMGRAHNRHHAGQKRSINDLAATCVWPKLTRDMAVFVKSCQICARNKVYRHEKTELLRFVAQQGKFETVQIDFIGPLPRNEDFRHIIVIKDRATRFTVLCPAKTQEHEELIHHFMNRWISYFGIPNQITSDNGKSFLSKGMKDMLNFLGIEYRPINSYSPWENGLVERVNRVCKAMLRTQENKDLWATNLPLINLYINNLIGIGGASAAQTTYGMSLHTPGVIFSDKTHVYDAPAAARMMEFHRRIKDTPFNPHPNRPIRDLQLHKATHVYLRIDKVISGLEPRYTGPHMVIKMGSKSAIISKNDKNIKVSRERLKPCTFLPLELEDLQEFLADIHPISPQTDAVIDRAQGDIDDDFNENLDIPPAQQQQEFAQLARELPFVNNIPGHQEINPTVEQQAVHRPTRRTNRPDRYGCNIFET